ncbi:hypothetical protein L6164_009004 [Bauhinia variegata]|uniref:Uncharacterized protein n=1 Tax=Bauhinia variegata TaxID=167791 RepID=A0ACB9PJX9_BAUVA|nr:hypothetical protein L6164_009004 [Bauhinia variegata]
MAVNFSLGSSFSAPPDTGLYASVGPVVDGYLINNYDYFDHSWSLYSFNNAPEGNTCDERVKAELEDCDSQAAVAVDDVLDRLPMDPFGMDIKSTITAISDWIQDFEWDIQSEYDVFTVDEDDHTLFAGLNWGWNGAGNLQPQGGNVNEDGTSVSGDDIDEFQIFNGLYDGGMVADENVENFLTISHRGNRLFSNEQEELQNCPKIDNGGLGDVPHEVMSLVLGYLGVKDLLSVEQVCKSLRDTVRTDPLLWRSIHVDQSLSARITDGTLLKFTSRAQGALECLNLINCIWITDSGLTSVLQSNPKLMKLSVPGCVKLTVEGILSNLRALKSSRRPGIKLLRIGRLAGITDEHFKELKDLLGADKYFQQRVQKPQFYQGGFSYLTCEDNRAIDIEVCPRCQKPKLVYDCPAEGCQQKHQAAQLCRGCTMCIPRCIHCGRCIKDCEYQETFCLEFHCLNCWNQLLHCPEKPVQKEATRCTIIGPSAMYQFYLYG